MAETVVNEQDYARKILSFVPVKRSFTNDAGKTVEYGVFEVTAIVSGKEYKFDVKTKAIDDKIAILELAENVE